MYKNLTYFNDQKSIKKYEKKMLEKPFFDNMIKTKDKKNEIVYVTPDVLISISKATVNFLVFNYNNYKIIKEIEKYCAR